LPYKSYGIVKLPSRRIIRLPLFLMMLFSVVSCAGTAAVPAARSYVQLIAGETPSVPDKLLVFQNSLHGTMHIIPLYCLDSFRSAVQSIGIFLAYPETPKNQWINSIYWIFIGQGIQASGKVMANCRK
jgi:hypothetical protein